MLYKITSIDSNLINFLTYMYVHIKVRRFETHQKTSAIQDGRQHFSMLFKIQYSMSNLIILVSTYKRPKSKITADKYKQNTLFKCNHFGVDSYVFGYTDFNFIKRPETLYRFPINYTNPRWPSKMLKCI